MDLWGHCFFSLILTTDLRRRQGSCCSYLVAKCYAQVAKSPNDHQGADIRCKSKRVFITKLELGLPLLPRQRLRRGAPSSGLHCLYRVFSREKFEKWEFPGWETSNWLPSVEAGSDWFPFPELATGSDWFPLPR